MMCLLRYLAAAQAQAEVDLLRRVTFIICPMANPDGAEEFRRRNAEGRDLNRDWCAQSQPETQAIEAAVRMWHPHAFADLHELPAHSARPAYQTNFVETLGPDPALSGDLGAECMTVAQTVSGRMRAYGFPLNVYFDDSSDSLALAHRYFGFRQGMYSFLFESKTGGDRDILHRMRFHLVGILTLAQWLAQKVGPVPAGPPAVLPASGPPPAPTVVARAPPARPDAATPAAAAADAEKPTIRLLKPQSGQTIQGTTSVVAEVTGASSVSYVTFAVDGATKALTNMAPYAWSLDTTRYESGYHSVLARAFGRGGSLLCQAQVTFSVANEAGVVAE
jgi:hypothetical protein